MHNNADSLQPKPSPTSKRVKPWPVAFQASVFQLVSELLTVGFSIRHALSFSELIFKRQLQDLRYINSQLRLGVTVSQAFEPYIDDQICLQLQLAEEHGQLSQSLGQISRLLATADQRQQKIRRLLRYPAMLLMLLVVIITGLQLIVFPQVQDLAGTSQSTHHWLWWGIGGIVIGLIGFVSVLQLKQQPILQRVEQLSRLPIIGGVMRTYYGYYFLAAYTILISSGLEMQEILRTLQRAKKTTLLHQLSTKLANQLAAGEPLMTALMCYRFMPAELQIILAAGQTKATMAQELTALTELYYQRLIAQLERLMAWIQPIAFLVIAGVILGTYVSLFLPMYHMIGGLG